MNEISPPPPINLDANLRRALLKALTELENEEKAQRNSTESTQTVVEDKIFEKASAAAVSFFAGPSSTTTTTTEGPTTTEKEIVVIQKVDGIQHKPLISYESNTDADEEQITSASSSFTSPDKFAFVKSNGEESKDGSVKANSLEVSAKPTPAPRRITTTTQATTFAPTEENEAKVEDVQFFSAPLVAAFTVHQDERGLPRSVVPIFKPPVATEPPPKKIENNPVNQQELLKQQEQLRSQAVLQEKQRALEEEIVRLQQQQQHQDFLFRQQQLFQEQQLQLHRQRLLEEQARLLRTPRPFEESAVQPLANSIQQNVSKPKGTLVSFQPSVTLRPVPNQVSSLPHNAQILPIKSAIDFHTNNFIRPQPLPPLTLLPQQPITTFQPVTFAPALPVHTRNFRHETHTGNFLNPTFNSFVQPIQQHRFFRNSLEGTQTFPFQAQAPIVNQQLNNLLYQTGIASGRQQEDLNIVSKVLSLNHLGGDQFFVGSEVRERREPAPVVEK